MRNAFKRFLLREDAAVTTDYVPLIAVAIGLGVAVIGAVFTGARTAGENVGEATRNVEVSGGLSSVSETSAPASAGDGGSGSAPGGAGSFVPGQGGSTGCQGVPGVSCSGLGDGSNPGAGSGNNNAGDTPGGAGVSNPGGGSGSSGGGTPGGGNGNSGGGNGNSGGGNSAGGNGNSGGGNSGDANPGQGGGQGQGNSPGNSGGAGNAGGGAGAGNGQGGSSETPPPQGGGQAGGGEDASAISADPDFVIPPQTLSEGWANTVTSDWLTFGENGALPGDGPVRFTVSGDGNPALDTGNGHLSEGEIPPWGTNIVIETPPCGTTATAVIKLDNGQTGIWQVSRPSWPAEWGTQPAGC